MIAVVLAAAAMILGTWLVAPTFTPIVVGIVMGVAWPLQAARRAAVAGVLAWGGLLAAAALRGDAVVSLSATLGAALGLPGWALFAVTLLYPAVMASSAAWLARLASPRRTRSFDGASVARGPSPT